MLGINLNNRDQRQTEIAHLSEQAVQRGLVGHRAGEQRIPVGFQREGQTLKPDRTYRPVSGVWGQTQRQPCQIQ